MTRTPPPDPISHKPVSISSNEICFCLQDRSDQIWSSKSDSRKNQAQLIHTINVARIVVVFVFVFVVFRGFHDKNGSNFLETTSEFCGHRFYHTKLRYYCLPGTITKPCNSTIFDKYWIVILIPVLQARKPFQPRERKKQVLVKRKSVMPVTA